MTNTNSIYDTTYIIYKHTNTISGKSYIGKTIKGLTRRWSNHISVAKNIPINSHFHKAIIKYGVDSWRHEILFVSFELDDDYLYEIEEELIKRFDTVENGYNITVGGKGVGSGEKNPFYGKTHSEETKQKISDSKKGKLVSDETKQKMSEVHQGIMISDETKQKISDSKKGEKHHRFEGYFVTPWGRFTSSSTGATELCSWYSVQKWCNNSDKVISKGSYIQSKYLQSLDESPVGKTFKDLGFGFEPAERLPYNSNTAVMVVVND